MDGLVNSGSPNQQLLTLKEVLRNPNLRQTNELVRSSTSNLSSNTLNHCPILFDLMKQCKLITSRIRRTNISRVDIYGKIDLNVFCKSSKGRKSKSRATNSI